jgi:hypothetical protein
MMSLKRRQQNESCYQSGKRRIMRPAESGDECEKVIGVANN